MRNEREGEGGDDGNRVITMDHDISEEQGRGHPWPKVWDIPVPVEFRQKHSRASGGGGLKQKHVAAPGGGGA